LYGPGVLLASGTRGYPAVGQEAFPGHLAINNQIKTLVKEGAHVYACRFAMGALYGFREDDLIPGVKPFNPLDVLDSALTAWREGRGGGGGGAGRGSLGPRAASFDPRARAARCPRPPLAASRGTALSGGARKAGPVREVPEAGARGSRPAGVLPKRGGPG